MPTTSKALLSQFIAVLVGFAMHGAVVTEEVRPPAERAASVQPIRSNLLLGQPLEQLCRLVGRPDRIFDQGEGHQRWVWVGPDGERSGLQVSGRRVVFVEPNFEPRAHPPVDEPGPGPYVGQPVAELLRQRGAAERFTWHRQTVAPGTPAASNQPYLIYGDVWARIAEDVVIDVLPPIVPPPKRGPGRR